MLTTATLPHYVSLVKNERKTPVKVSYFYLRIREAELAASAFSFVSFLWRDEGLL